MGKTREIKKRIKAVANIRRITKTMQMIATSKFARSQQAAQATKPYTETLFEVLSELSAGLGDVSHPLLERPGVKNAGKPLTLVITSDRGLCGPYNGGVLRRFMAALRENPAWRDGEIEVVGKKGQGFLKFAGVKVSKPLTYSDKPSYVNVRAMAESYIARFVKGEVSAVRVVYMRFITVGRQAPTVMQVLPFQALAKEASKAGEAAAGGSIYEFSPDAAALLNDILPAGVRTLLFQAFNDAIVSEHIARMVAMKSATDNAGKAGKKYTLMYNRARQAQITTELTEIISGAAALE